MKVNHKIKILITIAICSLILCMITGYFAWATTKIRTELNVTQDNLKTTLEELDTTKTELLITHDELKVKNDKIIELSSFIDVLNEDLRSSNIMIAELKSDEYELAYLGNFKISYYCNEPYKHICGYGKRITASGKPTEVGWTAAADWGVLPNGSIIYIEGIGFREIMDKGGSVNGKHIDVLVDTHNKALSFGISSNGVWILVKTY
jgi:3D (Asp-Asp-Asp) domain-containing protein